MPPLLPTHPRILNTIKVISSTLIAAALALLVGKLNGMIAGHAWLENVFWVGAIALLFHGVEGIAASVLAYRLKENPLKAGVYTFWTGVAGLTELLQRLENSRQATE